MEQSSGINLGCTAQDIKFTRVTGFTILDGPNLLPCNCTESCLPQDIDCGTEYELGTVFGACNGFLGDAITVQMNVDFLVSTTRYDIGMYIATNGGSALNGDECLVSSLQYGTYGDVQVWDVEGDVSSPNPAPDNCYDLGSTGTLTDYPFAPVTLSCTDSDGDGLLDFDIGVVWSVKKGGYDCDIDVVDKTPVASSSPKCWYDENTRANIPIYVPPEPIDPPVPPQTESPTLPPNTNEEEETTCPTSFNLCYALDMSGSVCNRGANINCADCLPSNQCQDARFQSPTCCANFGKVVDFASQMTRRLQEKLASTTGGATVEIIGTSVVEFATSAQVTSDMSMNANDTLLALEGMQYSGGLTHHGEAISVCQSTLPSSSSSGTSSEVRNFILLVTDGVPTRPTGDGVAEATAKTAASTAKNRGTIILPIFISDENDANQLNYMKLLSNDMEVFNIADFDELNGIIESLTSEVLCSSVGGIEARDDGAETRVNVPVVIGVLSNDSGNGTLVVNNFEELPVNGGGVVIVMDETNTGGMTLVYTPATDYVGEDTFVYEMCDESGACDTATVTVVILDIPDAIDDYATTLMNTDILVPVLINDVHDGTATLTSVTQPPEAEGLTEYDADGLDDAIPDDQVLYQPPADFVGQTTFTYTICQDDETSCDTATVTVDVLPPFPEAEDDSATTPMDTPISIPVLENDISILPLTSVHGIPSPPLHGTVYAGGTLAEGTVMYYPNAGYQGTDTFTYKVCDSLDQCAVANVVVTVTPPTLSALDDYTGTPMETPVTISVLSNDMGEDLVVQEITEAPSNGVAVPSADGMTVVYTPNENFVGEDTFVYTTCESDNSEMCDTATVTIDVILAVDDETTAPMNTPVTIPLLDNDHGVDLHVDSFTTASNGEVSIDPDSFTVTYTPNDNFVGIDTFTYTACEKEVGVTVACDTATVTVDVMSAVDDVSATPVNTPVTIPVLENDHGVDLVVSDVTDPPNGVVVPQEDGTVVYTPDTDFVGEDTFEYTTCERGTEFCDTATVTVVALDAVDDTTGTPMETPITIPVLTNDQGEDLTVQAIVDPPSDGTAVLQEDGTIIYTPNDNFVGVDTFTYNACVGDTNVCDTATVEVDVILAVDDTAGTPMETSVMISVLVNDHGVDLHVDSFTDPSNGEVAISEDGLTVVYTPNANFVGEDVFTYTACEKEDVVCDTATVTVDVILAVDDAAGTPYGTPITIPLLENDHGEDLHVQVTTQPPNGQVTISPDQKSVIYTPEDNFFGEDTFTYTACDKEGGTIVVCDTAMVTVDVILAVDDEITTPVGTPATVHVLVNDHGDNLIVRSIPSPPEDGDVTITPDGTVLYTPDRNFEGVDTFVYTACEVENGTTVVCDTAIVTVRVADQNLPPVAENDNVETTMGSPEIIDVLSNDSDPDDDPLVVREFPTYPEYGNVEVLGGQTVKYTPISGFTGLDTFTYTACDTEGLCDTAQVNVIVKPILADDVETTQEGISVIVDVVQNDLGLDLVVYGVQSAANGQCSITGNGEIKYEPRIGYVGQDKCIYTACSRNSPACGMATLVVNMFGAPTSMPSGMPSSSPTEAWYYPDWINSNQVCVNDFLEPEYMLQVQRENYLYRSKEECCHNHFWWRVTQCMANEHPMFFSTGEKCDQKVYFEYHEAKFTPGDWGASDLFETVEECCAAKFWWDVSACLDESPREMKLMFSVNVSSLLEPSFCQDADIIANALVTALEVGLGPDMRADINSIGGVTITRDADTGSPECGGSLAGMDFLGGTQGKTVIEDATGVITPVTVEIRKKCFESKTDADIAKLTAYIVAILEDYMGSGQLSAEIQSWAKERVPQVPQLFDSEVLSNSFIVTDVVNPFSPKPNAKFYPDWVNHGSCVNDGLEPSFIQENAGYYMFDTLEDCCTRHFANDLSCVST